MTRPRKDADRPRVNCRDCRFHHPADDLCPVARKRPVIRGWTTCQCFKPIRAKDRPRSDPAHTRQPASTVAYLRPLDADEVNQRLDAAGLQGVVAELRIEGQAVWVRFGPQADFDSMISVGALIRMLRE